MLQKITVVFTGFLIIVILSCRQRSKDAARLPVAMDDSSNVIINRSIAYAGSFDTFQLKKTLSFNKKTISYDSTGKILKELNQHFDYVLKPAFKARVTYKLHDTAITLIHDGQKARKLYNGKLSEDQKDIDNAWNSCYGSQFVICMPYKLKDPGIKASYLGKVKLADGLDAQVIKTSYMKGAGSNYDHVWYYYFEPGTGKLLANSFNGKNNYWDYTQYYQLEKISGLLMPSIRKGYNAIGLNKPGKLISETRHFNIVFDTEFPSDHFKIDDK